MNSLGRGPTLGVPAHVVAAGGGEQPGREWNGHHHARVRHPLVASAGATGDILDMRLRKGRAHTAEGGLEFILEVLDRAERLPCGKAAVRFGSGYPGEAPPSALEARGRHYVARVRDNSVLQRLAPPAIDALAREAWAGKPRDGDESGTWTCELDEPYRAKSWSRARRVVQVLVERPGEPFPRSFQPPASLPAGEVGGRELLAMYRRRGKAGGHMGELMSVAGPALSSSPRHWWLLVRRLRLPQTRPYVPQRPRKPSLNPRQS